MSARYDPALTKSGTYTFATDSGYNYSPYFTLYYLLDEDGNQHTVYHFGFDRGGSYDRNPFEDEHDEKIKNTIIYIVNEFFRKNGDNALLYFCHDEDGFGRHRSIVFGKWFKELVGITHYKRNATYNARTLYAALLVKTDNPLAPLIINAFDNHFNEIMGLDDSVREAEEIYRSSPTNDLTEQF